MPRPRILLVLVALLLLVPCAAGAIGIEKGVKLGVNFADLRGDFADVANPDAKMGVVGGPFVAFAFAPEVALQVEALYSMKGAKLAGTLTDESGNVLGTFHTFESLNYLEVPLLLRGTPLPSARVRPMILAGPTLGFALGANLDTDEPSIPSVKLKNMKAVDVGFAIGGGARIHAGGAKWVVTEVRYTTGFSDLWDIQGNLESINSVFSFTAGLEF